MENLNRRRRQSGDSCDCLRPVIRFWGIFTAVVLCGVGSDIAFHGHKAGIFILLGSALVLFFEIKWVITLFVQLLFASDNLSSCVQCWSTFRIAGGWRIAPFYIAFGIALIFWPNNLWLSYVAGAQLLVLAILRLCTIFRFNGNTKGEGLLPQYDDAFDKSDVLSDGVDDSFPEACQNLEDEEAIDVDS